MEYLGVRDFYQNVAKNKRYWIPCMFFMILSYGFSALNRTVSADDLTSIYYVGEGSAMIAAMRWGMSLWSRIFLTMLYTPFIAKFLGLVFMFIALIMINTIFYEINGRQKNIYLYTTFSCLVITYPLINEIWEFNGANMINMANLVMISAAILYQMKTIRNLKTIIIAGIILTPVMSGYESGIFSYISLVMMILYIKYRDKTGRWFTEGLRYSWPLFIALLLRVSIGYVLIKIYGLEYRTVGSTGIGWLKDIKFALVNITIWNFVMFIQRGLVYFPITVFVFAAVIFFLYSITLSIRKKTSRPILLSFMVVISLFFLSIVQGSVLLYRASQNISLFVAFTGYVLLNDHIDHRKFFHSIFILLMFLCLRQSIYLHQILALNNQRSDNEIALVHDIGIRLYQDFDISKKVVFACKEYDFGEWIRQQITDDFLGFRDLLGLRKIDSTPPVRKGKFIDSNMNSLISWSQWAFRQKALFLLFSYCGYDLISSEVTSEQLSYYNRIAAENNMKPFEIRDMGDYILVCLDKPKQHH